MSQLRRVTLAGHDDPWVRAGFTVVDGTIVVGRVAIVLSSSDEGRDGVISVEVEAGGLDLGDPPDGLPMHASSEATKPLGSAHPNGVTGIDHVVAFTPDLDRTADALARSGLELRRRREAARNGNEVHQLFYWLGDVILEIVSNPRLSASEPAGFWGLAFTVSDLDETVKTLGPLLGEAREAVQKGRRIASVRRTAGLSVPVAFMTPHTSRR